MRSKNTKKIIIGFLIVAEVLIWPLSVFAQAVPTCDPNGGSSCAAGYVAGIAANTAELGVLTADFKLAYQTACLIPVQAAEKVYASLNLPASTAAVLSPGGNEGQVSAMTTLTTAYLEYMICAGLQLGQSFAGTAVPSIVFANLPASSAYTSSVKQSYLSQINTDLNNYTKKEQNLSAQLDNANQGFWKTLIISALLQTSKAIADSLVAKLVNNYKISNLKQYTDSVATLMYDNQFLHDNFPATQDQAMARQVLTNPLFRSQIQPGIFVKANAALGFDPTALSPNDPNYYTKMAMVGSSPANPYYLQTSLVAGVDQSHGASVATAQAHIAQGSGYKAPVNCAGSLTQQQQIDQQTKAASDRLAAAQAQYNNLTSGGASASDIKKAQADLTAAQNAWQNLSFPVTGPNSVSNSQIGGGNNTEGTAAIVMCEAVSSPAVLVNQGIDSIFKAFGANLTQYNGSNLPSYINLITGVASQIGSSMVLGGVQAGATSALVNENKTVPPTANLAGQYVFPPPSLSQGNGIEFDSPISSGINSYILNWNVSTAQIPNAASVTIMGPGITGSSAQVLTGSLSVNTTTGGTYTLTVLGASGKILATATQTLTPVPAQTSYNTNPNAPEVAGAYTERAPLDVRGPAVVVSPRGE